MTYASIASARKLSGRDVLFIAVAAFVGASSYLIASQLKYGFGFPLDDSWIHATYARNLAVAGEWSFQLGNPSAGSTAPFYTLLLAPGFLLGVGPLWWSYILGYAALVGLGLTAEWIMRQFSETYAARLPWVGVFVALEWHMLWAATAGMETILHALLATLALALISRRSRRFAALGLLVGLSVWVRPDGLTLAAPALIAVWGEGRAQSASPVRAIVSFALGFFALFIPYLAFNLWLSGTPMPNTFYAKQAEYAAWQARPIAYRVGIGLAQISAGPFLLLWPGLIAATIRSCRTRNIGMLSSVAWAVGYVGLYLLRLPAYQHGRYLMPAMPILLLVALGGYVELRSKLLAGPRWWALGVAWQGALVLVSLGFIVLGARAYAADVAIIESEMVATAAWVSQNLPPDAVVAAHDIGALGYFDQHQLIDLAGLVSPEVVPFIRDEGKLAEFLDSRGADYLIAFPDLYPELAQESRVDHATGGPFAPPGLGNMTVYCWRCE